MRIDALTRLSLAALLALAGASQAQEPSGGTSEPAAGTTAPAATDGREKERTSAAGAASEEVFKPSEQISPDSAVSFPADI